jgi:uncharacterized peroxidase-related enzyme
VAYITILDDEESPVDLQEMYARMAPAGTPVDNILRIHSLNPKSLQVHYDLYKHLMYGPSDLTRAEREMIAVVVSRVNDCHY